MDTTEAILNKIHETLDSMNKNIANIHEKIDIRLSMLEPKSTNRDTYSNVKVSKWLKTLKEK